MEYRPKNITALLEQIKLASPEDAAQLLQEYGNIRESRGIERGWAKCTQLHRKCAHLKRKRLDQFTMNEENGWVELHQVNKFAFFVMDALEKKGLSDLADDISVKLGTVRIDRRFTFIND